jgi:hypothetical protein
MFESRLVFWNPFAESLHYEIETRHWRLVRHPAKWSAMLNARFDSMSLAA